MSSETNEMLSVRNFKAEISYKSIGHQMIRSVLKKKTKSWTTSHGFFFVLFRERQPISMKI